jgi:RHS repeat-associated protein
MTRANGVQTTYTYDAIGRVTVLSAGGQSQRFTYDSCANGLGRMCTAADANGSVGYSYTPEGWISGRAFTVGSTSYTVGYAYNAMGQVVTVVYPDGNQALYNYTNGVVSSVSLNIGGAGRTAASQITYQPRDTAMASWVGSNSLTTTLYYDTDGRFTGANVPGVLTYGVYYDNASRIIRKQDFISPILTESFGYDDQSRLVSVQGGAENEAYQYDANGNRIAQTVNGTSMTLVYEGGSNRMINAGGVTFGYDAMGNSSVANGISRWQFDPFNRMTTAFGNTYYIDPLGQRLMKSVGSTTTYFAPDENNHLIAENDSGLWVDYIWLNGRLIARIHGGQMEDIHLDQVGRPEAMTNADQTLAWRAMNTPFTRSVATNNAVPLNIGFPGQYYDTELSLWNNGYRDYFPWVGRYLESDPIGLAGGINTYSYVGGNPVTRIDPSGLASPYQPSPITALEEAILEGNVEQVEMLAEAAGVPEEGALARASANANKISHIFDKAQHNLDPLVKTCGSKGRALKQLADAAAEAFPGTANGVPAEFSVNVNGVAVTVRGVLVNGKFMLGTAFIP